MPLQLRRGLEADRTTITPADGEPIVVEDGAELKLYVGDGSTAGGRPISGGGSGTPSPLTTKGDVFVYASGNTRLAVGSTGQVLTVDLAQPTGLKWADAPMSVLSAFTQDVDGAGKRLSNVKIVGNIDVPYDLNTDPDGMVTGTTINLSPVYNFYYITNLTASMTIDLPTPAAGTAPYGQVSVQLGDTGSLALEDPVVWGKTDPNDPDGIIPVGNGQAFTLFYRFDPTVSKYVTNIEYLEVVTGGGGGGPAGVVQVVPNSTQVSNLPHLNTHSFEHTHNYVTTSQDGTVWLVVVWVGDRVSGSDYTPDAKTTVATNGTVSNYDPRIIIAIYKPTQDDLNSGSEDFLITTDHPASGETGQFLTFEIKGANPTNPVDTTAEDGIANANVRSSVGPLNTVSSQDDSLLVTVCGAGNLGGGSDVQLSVQTLNGFTEVGHYTGSAGVICEFYVHAKEVDAGNFGSPTFTVTPDVPLQLLSVVFKP